MAKPFATATYHDTWAGNVTADLVGFKTKRRGESVTRFRWVQANGQGAGGFVAGGFSTVSAALRAATRHANFSNVPSPAPQGWDVAETSVEA
ncbi:MAG TPA: hypothetical protein VL133_13675 [Devosia sp.]|nr:hypothetical protein [Devosia sp.]